LKITSGSAGSPTVRGAYGLEAKICQVLIFWARRGAVFFFGAAKASRLDRSHIKSTQKGKGKQKAISHTGWELHTCEHEQHTMDRRSTAAWKMGRQLREGIAKKIATCRLPPSPSRSRDGDGGSPNRAGDVLGWRRRISPPSQTMAASRLAPGGGSNSA
jgi:hypothetical protein